MEDRAEMILKAIRVNFWEQANCQESLKIGNIGIVDSMWIQLMVSEVVHGLSIVESSTGR